MKGSRDSLESSRSSNGAALTLEAVTKRYGAMRVLEPLALSIQPGESVAVVGPSGAGKTTLLLLMAGALQPTEGRVLLHGRDLTEMQPGAALSRLVGMVHQQFDLIPNLSALHNVLAGRLGAWSLWRSMVSLVAPRDRQLGLAALDRMGIASRARLRAGRLSGGEQQRVAIARLLVQDPAVVLADEPVSSLDPARADEVARLLVEVAHERGKTLVASLHSVELACAHFQRVIGLRNGAVQFDVPSAQVSDGMLRELYDLRGLRDETDSA